jgi:hypothetical protein
MPIYNDPFQGLPAPSDFELQDDFNRRRRLADKREYREALAEAEHRIERLETALTATIRALAFGETTYPEGRPEKHGLCGQETAEPLARAAQVLGLDLNDLGLAYAVTCPHGDDPVFCNECRGICDDPP